MGFPDAVLTVLFNIWAENPELREQQYFLTCSEHLTFLVANFHSIYNGKQQFEQVCDILQCLLQWRWPDLFMWGCYTGIHKLLNVILMYTVLVVEAEFFSPNLHFVDRIDSLITSNSCCLTIMSDFVNIQEYVDNMDVECASTCLRCGEHLVPRYVLTTIPKFFSFDLSQVQDTPTLNDTVMVTTSADADFFHSKP